MISQRDRTHARNQRRAMWMLAASGLSLLEIARAFNLSKARVGEIVATYERQLEFRRRRANLWPEPFACRLRAAGAI